MSIKEPKSHVPSCPYTHLECVRFNPVKKCGVCQNHANKNAKSIRCSFLPTFVKDGWHLAILKGERLHV